MNTGFNGVGSLGEITVKGILKRVTRGAKEIFSNLKDSLNSEQVVNNAGYDLMEGNAYGIATGKHRETGHMSFFDIGGRGNKYDIDGVTDFANITDYPDDDNQFLYLIKTLEGDMFVYDAFNGTTEEFIIPQD